MNILRYLLVDLVVKDSCPVGQLEEAAHQPVKLGRFLLVEEWFPVCQGMVSYIPHGAV